VSITIPKELAQQVLDHLYELRGERAWWEHEPRRTYQKDYRELCEQIEKLQNLLRDNNPIDDNAPLTKELLELMGFKAVPSDMGPEQRDHMEKGGINLWEFNDTGEWHYNEANYIFVKTAGELRALEKLVNRS
jgi:hypothetical protein